MLCLKKRCGAASVGEKIGDFVAQCEISTEDEAARQRLVVRQCRYT